MESLGLSSDFWRDRSVFVTGQNGFKGGWLSLWLAELGARVFGYGKREDSGPCLFDEMQLDEVVEASTFGDVCDPETLGKAMRDASPSIVIHLAAQPLVRESYRKPIETFNTNILGTLNVLDAALKTQTVRSIINVTSDKCYKNIGSQIPYREDDPLGGNDPYSSSKACAELLSVAYRESFLAGSDIQLATARAGNVIGGGDWALERLIPDIFRAIEKREPVQIRSPTSVRPWQHVLEPLSGYLSLAEKLTKDGGRFAEAWNFGPNAEDAKPVLWILEFFKEKYPNLLWNVSEKDRLHEEQILKLDISKARERMGWKPRWNISIALEKTIDWNLAWKAGKPVREEALSQIREFAQYGKV
ncbi:MAG: CDP-glucose 4,6-dehydratase [Rhodospirillaceae bacterium]